MAPDQSRTGSSGRPGTGASATGATASGPGTPSARADGTRSATDSRVTEAFEAIVPRRLRRRYADDHAERPGQTGQAGAQEPPDERPDDGARPDDRASIGDDDGTAGDVVGAPGHSPAAGRPRWIGIGAAALAVLVLLTTAWGFAGRSQVYGGVRSVAALDLASDAITDTSSQAADRNVLVLGLQADRGATPEAARTDTAVLVHQPAGDAPAVTLALPATLEVPRPPCRRWDPATGAYGETVPAESRTAFAAAYDVGGPACTVGVVQQLTGIPVTGFVAHDLAGTAGLVDAVGGVEVCTERPVVDPVLGPVVPVAGRSTLDGDTAARFAAASAVADSSPAGRVQRQQRVLAAALGDALSAASLLTPGRPGRAAEGLSGSVVADGVSAGEILTLARGLSRAGTAGDGSTPTFLQVPVADAPNTRGHLDMQDSEAGDLFSALREHGPLPAEATAPASRAATTAPPGATVDLVDATGRPGAVDAVAGSLRERGYTIGTVTTGPATEGTAVRYSPDRTDAAGALTQVLPAARPAPDPASSGALQVVVGSALRAPGPLPAADAGTDVDCG